MRGRRTSSRGCTAGRGAGTPRSAHAGIGPGARPRVLRVASSCPPPSVWPRDFRVTTSCPPRGLRVTAPKRPRPARASRPRLLWTGYHRRPTPARSPDSDDAASSESESPSHPSRPSRDRLGRVAGAPPRVEPGLSEPCDPGRRRRGTARNPVGAVRPPARNARRGPNPPRPPPHSSRASPSPCAAQSLPSFHAPSPPRPRPAGLRRVGLSAAPRRAAASRLSCASRIDSHRYPPSFFAHPALLPPKNARRPTSPL